MAILKYFWINVIILPAIVTGLDFSFTRQSVLLGSDGTLSLTCSITEKDVSAVYLLQIRRLRDTTLSGEVSTDWTTLAIIEPGSTDTPSLHPDITASDKDYVAGGSWDSNSPGNTVLTLSMNIQKLVCADARYYRCGLSYKSSTTQAVTTDVKNNTFTAYVKPQVKSLDVRGFIGQGLASTNPASVNEGDELELTCNAQIGSRPGTLIRWHRTSETASTNEFIGYQPPQGTYDDGTATSDNQCGYTRVATIRYNATAADAKRDNNLAFECYVTVSGDPYENSYTSVNNPKFYADVTGSGGDNTETNVVSEGVSTTQTTLVNSQTSGDDQISVSLGVIVGIVIASLTVGVVIGVVFTLVVIRKMKSVLGLDERNKPDPRESREMSAVVSSSATQSQYESLKQGTSTSHTYAGLQ